MVKLPFTNRATKFKNLSTYHRNLTSKKSSIYQLPKIVKLRLYCFSELTNTKSQKPEHNHLQKSSPNNFLKFTRPTNSKSQKPANCHLFSLNQGGPTPLDSHLLQPWGPELLLFSEKFRGSTIVATIVQRLFIWRTHSPPLQILFCSLPPFRCRKPHCIYKI